MSCGTFYVNKLLLEANGSLWAREEASDHGKSVSMGHSKADRWKNYSEINFFEASFGQQYEAGDGRRQPGGRSGTLLNSQEEDEGRVLGGSWMLSGKIKVLRSKGRGWGKAKQDEGRMNIWFITLIGNKYAMDWVFTEIFWGGVRIIGKFNYVVWTPLSVYFIWTQCGLCSQIRLRA